VTGFWLAWLLHYSRLLWLCGSPPQGLCDS